MLQRLKDIELIVIHCTASREDREYTFDQLKRDHNLRGFRSCGYHIYIRRDGTIHNGRPLTTVGAHVAGHNMNTIGICYEGGLDSNGRAKDTRTKEQMWKLDVSILTVLDKIRKAGGDYKAVKVMGHRDLSPDINKNGVVEPDEWIKQCPCFNATEEYQDIASNL